MEHLFLAVARVMDRVGKGAFYALRNGLLNGLGHDGILSIILGVSLAAVCVVDL